MTKGELIEFLQPFCDDIEIVIAPNHLARYHGTLGVEYGITGDGTGKVVMNMGPHLPINLHGLKPADAR